MLVPGLSILWGITIVIAALMLRQAHAETDGWQRDALKHYLDLVNLDEKVKDLEKRLSIQGYRLQIGSTSGGTQTVKVFRGADSLYECENKAREGQSIMAGSGDSLYCVRECSKE